jgi:superfamily II DNA or RNA helicase
VSQGEQFLKALLGMPEVPPHSVPPELAYERIEVLPRPRLDVRRAPAGWPPDLLRASLAFDYDGAVIGADRPGDGAFQTEPRRLIVRSPDAERVARERVGALGIRARWAAFDGEQHLGFASRALPKIVRTLLDEGWHVEAEGGVYRKPGRLDLSVTSGIDWFELHGAVDFDGEVIELPALLAALRRGDQTVRLGDGTYGLLPGEWLRRYAAVAALGTPADDHVRFRRTQVGVLDALVAAQPEIDVDSAFARARAELRRFGGVAAADPPPGFTGLLRDYQREALGWFHFLRRFGFGGCLADDMGLGKTVMVLALLESRRAEPSTKPSLVVVPRSLVFNWKQEAARFAPGLRLLDHTGIGRRPVGAHFADHDVVLTTYGTLRRDVVRFRDVEFDCVVLDEAQAIKNSATDAAKAARLLRGDFRLALSGTPIENHLGELWSQFEFLNPGMLGAADALGLDGSAGRAPDEATRALLARALRPFILRRTKTEVAPELPSRTEQIVYCELEPAQRRLYDELRDHYRRSLLARVDAVGIARSKIVVLEALLRLRQAACHPGLIDRGRVGEPAGKLDVLLPRLQEILDAGHKAIVFSQFTSFLAIVRRRLEAEKIRYEYLDGATRDREARVTRFQTDPDCRLFLVSLKAGGLGLNLTAAEHVFLLDPWWNPAVEAQAIDRTHRIGQTRPVLAFRLIAPDTVEEKILALQRDKRDLAEAIVNAQNSLIRTLTREDLELLLS